MILFFDTETTGLPNLKLPPSDPSQPRIVQIAALLTTDNGEEVGSFNVIVDPKILIPDQATKVHGITNSMVKEQGIDADAAMDIFDAMARKASLYVGHNISFDAFIVNCVYAAVGYDFISLENIFCTMKEMTPICRFPSKFRGSTFKWPKLSEAYEFCFKKPLEKAHDALADVRACKEIFFWLKQNRENYLKIAGPIIRIGPKPNIPETIWDKIDNLFGDRREQSQTVEVIAESLIAPDLTIPSLDRYAITAPGNPDLKGSKAYEFKRCSCGELPKMRIENNSFIVSCCGGAFGPTVEEASKRWNKRIEEQLCPSLVKD